MSDSLQELYQEVILDHNRRPRNFRAIEGGDRQEGYNPLCGDRVTVYMTIENGVVTDVAFEGVGCAIAKASASLMTEALRGLSVDQARERFRRFQAMVTSAHDAPAPELGKLSVLAGVREFPTRVKCASLAWHAARAVLDGAPAAPVSTE
ncbi:MAG: SUF system NifU family Fe-S cluster assembly protein [Acidobacteria bacterium]|nr:SUF system NifU family Fe-S cluster assembly protein [Acidobacteriota bacterium]